MLRKAGEIEMTKQEAIETIRMAIAQVEWEYPMNYAVAFDMAVEALSQPEIIRCQECVSKECMGRGGQIVCGITGEQHAPDWYCGDGERGEEEDGQ